MVPEARVMRILIALLAAGAAVAGEPGQSRDGAAADPQSITRPFPAGGRIRMDLSAGEYSIEGTPREQIRVDWRAKEGSRRAVDTRIDIRGNQATVVTDGHLRDVEVHIEIPSRADLFARLTAGELSLEGVEGNKDVALHAGELRIDVVRADDYRAVDGGVWAGEIHAAPFGIAKEGLFRSFSWNGRGRYRLSARLKAGELWLLAPVAPEARR
jgi:hypothetical protein